MHCPVQGNSKSILGFVNFLYWILWTTSDTAQRSSFIRLDFGVEYFGFQSQNVWKKISGRFGISNETFLDYLNSLDTMLWIPDPFSVKLGFQILLVISGFPRIPWAQFRIPNPRIPLYSQCKNFPHSGSPADYLTWGIPCMRQNTYRLSLKSNRPPPLTSPSNCT